jgi:hypothetical protein
MEIIVGDCLALLARNFQLAPFRLRKTRQGAFGSQFKENLFFLEQFLKIPDDDARCQVLPGNKDPDDLAAVAVQLLRGY